MDSQDTGAISFSDISAVLPHHLDELADVGVGARGCQSCSFPLASEASSSLTAALSEKSAFSFRSARSEEDLPRAGYFDASNPKDHAAVISACSIL